MCHTQTVPYLLLQVTEATRSKNYIQLKTVVNMHERNHGGEDRCKVLQIAIFKDFPTNYNSFVNVWVCTSELDFVQHFAMFLKEKRIQQ